MILKNLQNFSSLQLGVNLGKALVDAVLPPRCPISHDIVDRQGMVSPRAWMALNFIADPVCATCGVPMELDLGADSVCVPCLTRPPVYDRARAALVYDDHSKGVILGFKHGDQTHAVVSFIPWLKQAGAAVLDTADILMPVPLHRWRLLQRRYNQSAVMAAYLAGAAGKPALMDGLIRVRSTPIQGHLNRQERARNVRRAFAVNPRHAVAGKNILLIDDVFTTGATVSECAAVLKKAGAGTVNVLTLARVVRAQSL